DTNSRGNPAVLFTFTREKRKLRVLYVSAANDFQQNEKAAIAGGLRSFNSVALVVFVAGTLPRHELANRRARAGRCGRRSFVGLDIAARGLFATHGTNTEPHFLFGRVHLDDLELELLTGFQLDGLALRVRRFRVVAQALDPIGDLDEGAEARQAQ